MPSPPTSEFDYVPSAQKHLLTRTKAADPAVLAAAGLDVDNIVTAELREGSELYGLVCRHLASDKFEGRTNSFILGIGSARRDGGCCGSDPDDCEYYRNAARDLGLGCFDIEHQGEKVVFHTRRGEVVGTDCGATLLKNLVITASSIKTITSFCDKLIEEADKTDSYKFNVYRFVSTSIGGTPRLSRRARSSRSCCRGAQAARGRRPRRVHLDRLEEVVPRARHPLQAQLPPPRRARSGQDLADPGARGAIQAQRLLPVAVAPRHRRRAQGRGAARPGLDHRLEDIDGVGAAHRDHKSTASRRAR